MPTRFRIAGLALGVILLMTAATAAHTSAASFTAGEYPATLTQETPVSGNHIFEFGTGTLTCNTAHFDSVGELEGASKSFEVAPTYSSCTAPGPFGGKVGTVIRNGCVFEFTATAGTVGVIDLSCPESSGMKIMIYSSVSDHGSNKPVCEYLAEPQTLEEVSYLNVTPTYMTASMSSTIAVTRESGTAGDCGAASQNVTYSGSTILEAKASEMLEFGLSESQFTASEYNATVTGRQSPAQNYEIVWQGGAKVSCHLSLSGAEALAKASESVSVGQTYDDCTPAFPLVKEATVVDNGCGYDLSITEAGEGVWLGDTELECPGKAMEVILYATTTDHPEEKALCKYVVEPQKVSGVTYELMTARYLRLKFNASLAIKRVVGTVVKCGAVLQNVTVMGSTIVEFHNESGEPVVIQID